MALPDKDLTTGQASVMEPLIANFQAAKSRLEGSQLIYNKAVLALEEYVKQSAEKLEIDVVKEYTFDVDANKFKDKAAMASAAVAEAAGVQP